MHVFRHIWDVVSSNTLSVLVCVSSLSVISSIGSFGIVAWVPGTLFTFFQSVFSLLLRLGKFY